MDDPWQEAIDHCACVLCQEIDRMALKALMDKSLHSIIFWRGHDIDYFEERKRLRHCYGCRKLTNRWYPARLCYFCEEC